MSHNHNHNHQVEGKNLFFSIILNVVITLAQVIGGIISGSLALLSDALHNFSDVLSLVFSYVAHKLSRKKASLDQTFGLKRAELIAAFVNAFTLVLVALYLAVLGIVVNGISVLLLKKDADKNLNMKSAYLHLLTDMLASVAVLVGGLLMFFYQIYWIDSVLTLFIAIYLIVVGVDLLKKATKMLMLFTPEEINLKELIKEVHKIKGVNKLHHIHVWHLNEEELHLEAHLDCSEDIKMSEFNVLLLEVEDLLLKKFGINHINIQPEFKKEDSKDYIVQD